MASKASKGSKGKGGKGAAAAAGGGGSAVGASEVDDQGLYKIKTFVMAIYKRDQQFHKAKVIERRKLQEPDGSTRTRYYVHYEDFNRRMDDWVEADQVEPYGGVDGRLEVDETDEQGVVMKGTRDNVHFIEPEHGHGDGMDADSLREHEEVTKCKNVRYVELGRYRMEAWYFSPFPKELWEREGNIDTLYFHEFSLQFFKHDSELARHARKYTLRHPPGDEIYRCKSSWQSKTADGKPETVTKTIAVFELDGLKEKMYCQNLCYLAKLFLDHKTLYYDVDTFMFYVFCEVDEYGYHLFGYYSKEKYSEAGLNLACILSLPCYQRRGYGRFIIQFSYELSKREKRLGSPEKPLSDLGLLSYRAYWTWILFGLLLKWGHSSLSIFQLASMTSIKLEDVLSTLQYHGLIKFTPSGYVIRFDRPYMQAKFDRYEAKPGPRVDPTKLRWTPLVVDIKKDKWLIKSKAASRKEPKL